MMIGAASGRKGPQTLCIQPPWTTNAIPVVVGPEYGETELTIPRPEVPAGETPPTGTTGLYRLHAATPYDPAQDGIPGPEHDLGALIHSVGMVIQ
jgi:hypothetical protein